MPKKKKNFFLNVVIPRDEDAQKLDYSYIAIGNAKFPTVSRFLKTNCTWNFHDLVGVLLGIFPREIKIYVHTHT